MSKTFGGPLLAFPESQWGSHWTPELLLRLGTVQQVTGFLLFPWVDFLRGDLSEAYPNQYCCNVRASCPQVRVQIRRQASGDRIPRQVKTCWPSKNWISGQVEAC